MDVAKEIRGVLNELREIEVKISVLQNRRAERQSSLRKLRTLEAMPSSVVKPALAMAS